MPALMLVESPEKIKHIRKYLAKLHKDDINVAASLGHIRDLPLQDLGVNLETLIPTYVVTEDRVELVKKLKDQLTSCDCVYLATDPDREGEAIAWHLVEALELKKRKIKIVRIKFDRVSEIAIKAAFDDPGEINMPLVFSQEARRVIDRLVGYLVSPRLGNKLSAGRVQSPALRMVVEREQEIEKFKSINYYDVKATHSVGNESWSAIWQHKIYRKETEKHWLDESIVIVVSKTRRLTALQIIASNETVRPDSPLTTVKLQKIASSKLKISPDKTMRAAQSLFANGFISYHRTDNPNISDETFERIRASLIDLNLPCIEKKNTWSSNKSAQEAHEAIVPLDFTLNIAGETEEEQKVYQLIKSYALASQMPSAIYSIKDVVFESDVAVPLDGKKALFSARNRKLITPGWKRVIDDIEDAEIEDGDPGNSDLLLMVQQGMTYLVQSEVLSKKTSPPNRYSEAELIEKMEKTGIGRPSTYPSIISNIKDRSYVVVNKNRKLEPTEKGVNLINILLDSKFSFVNYDWTTLIEERLDLIVTRQDKYVNIVRKVLDDLNSELIALPEELSNTFSLVERMTCQCGGHIERNHNLYKCAACDNKVWRNVSNRELTQDEIATLFLGEELVGLTGFENREKKSFTANLRISKEKKVVELFFDDTKNTNNVETELTEKECSCGGKIEKSEKFWRCTQCKSIVWSTISNRRISNNEAYALLSGEKLFDLDGFKSKGSGKEFVATLKIDNKKVVFDF